MINKRDKLIIVNKYEEANVVDANCVVERVFKMFYEMQITKKVM